MNKLKKAKLFEHFYSILLDKYNEERNKSIFLSHNTNKISDETLNYTNNKNQINNEFDEEKLEKKINFFSENKNKSLENEDWTAILTFSRFLKLGSLFYEKIDTRLRLYIIIIFSSILLPLLLYIIYSITKCNINEIIF